MPRLYHEFLGTSCARDAGTRRLILEGIRHSTPNQEEFAYVEGVARPRGAIALPHCELLSRPREAELHIVSAGSVEEFYRECHKMGLDAQIDSMILEKFLPESLRYEAGVSINLCARTAYSADLLDVFQRVNHSPEKTMLEFSEAKNGGGRLPAEYDPKVLGALKKKGYRFALDDVNPEVIQELECLSIFAYIDAVKFDYQIAARLRKAIRTGDKVDRLDAEIVVYHIGAISRLCPNALLIMEGVRATDGPAMMNYLKDAGIYAYQKSNYVDPLDFQLASAPTGLELIH